MESLDPAGWPLTQLQRIAKHQPERARTILQLVLQHDPELYVELAVSAVDQEMLSIEDASQLTGLSEEEIHRHLVTFRNHVLYKEVQIVRDETRGNVARLANGQIPIWEIIREYRRLKSLDELALSFPQLTKSEIAVAIRYAEQNSEEIQCEIDGYESMTKRLHAEYPYAGS